MCLVAIVIVIAIVAFPDEGTLETDIHDIKVDLETEVNMLAKTVRGHVHHRLQHPLIYALSTIFLNCDFLSYLIFI